jgi:transcription antitermination factor NusG
MTIKQLVKEINNSNLSIEDLRILNELVVRNIKAQKKAAAILNSTKLSVGMEVKVNHPKLAGRTGTITEIKRTRAVVQLPIGSYNIPMNILEAV